MKMGSMFCLYIRVLSSLEWPEKVLVSARTTLRLSLMLVLILPVPYGMYPQYPVEEVVSLLSPRSLLQLLTCVLLECQVLLVSAGEYSCLSLTSFLVFYVQSSEGHIWLQSNLS